MNYHDRLSVQVANEKGWHVRIGTEARAALALNRCGVEPSQVTTQHRVGKFWLDFAFVDRKIAIEIDGPLHFHPDAATRDRLRDYTLRAAGWIVLRVDAGELQDAQVERICAELSLRRSP